MKKILCLILCLIMACTMLVSCDEEQIGDGIGEYPSVAQTVERLTLNMYIITGDSTTSNAVNTVSTRINGHTKTTYNTDLKIFYVKASEYEATVNAAITAGGANTPHIVLINSKNMFDSLYGANKLTDLSSYYSSRDFGRLNTQIASSLLESSKVNSKLYTVPNNRVIGEYKYLVINKDEAMLKFHYTNAELSSYKSLADAQGLIAEMAQAGYTEQQINALVYTVNGPYELREELENENFCNIISVPQVTHADAFSSAFAIINNAETKYNDRAMQMIYAINNDVEFRNFLQYGVFGSNYTTSADGIVRIIDGENNYDMNLIHTGDVFRADNCVELGWTDAAKGNGKLQNADSVAVTE